MEHYINHLSGFVIFSLFVVIFSLFIKYTVPKEYKTMSIYRILWFLVIVLMVLFWLLIVIPMLRDLKAYQNSEYETTIGEITNIRYTRSARGLPYDLITINKQKLKLYYEHEIYFNQQYKIQFLEHSKYIVKIKEEK